MVTIIEIMWEPMFTEKFIAPSRNCFPASENQSFHLSDIPGSENCFSQGKRSFNKFFIRASGNEFFV